MTRAAWFEFRVPRLSGTQQAEAVVGMGRGVPHAQRAHDSGRVIGAAQKSPPDAPELQTRQRRAEPEAGGVTSLGAGEDRHGGWGRGPEGRRRAPAGVCKISRRLQGREGRRSRGRRGGQSPATKPLPAPATELRLPSLQGGLMETLTRTMAE